MNFVFLPRRRNQRFEKRGCVLVAPLTVVFGVLQGSVVEEGGADPVQGHMDVRDGVEDDLSIQVLN